MDQTLHEAATAWRRHLHANPGLTLHEGQTAAFVAERLREMGVAEIETGVGGHGVVATLRRAGGNRAVGLRADMDALPTQEKDETLPWRSTTPGVMHACGHDGHTATLLATAALLLQDKGWTGTIRLVFQPAEEGGRGALAMLDDGLLQRFPMERIFGWHNWPGLPAGTIAVHDGAVMAAGARFAITFEGHAGHAALPHMTRDPMLGLGHAIVAIQSIAARSVDPLKSAVVSVTVAEAGEATNQVPARATLRGTCRWLDEEVGALIFSRLEEIVQGVAATYGLTGNLEIPARGQVTINSPAERDLAAAAAAHGSTLRRDIAPAMTGEDFAQYLQKIPGAFVWIGNGPADGGRELHHPNYDFNDAIIPAAAHYMAEVARRALSEA